MTECLESIKSMEGNKAPGMDGLPVEFYKVFWKDVRELLVNSLNYSYASGKLSVTQRRGVFQLIPKKDTELYYCMSKTGDQFRCSTVTTKLPQK